MEGFEPRTVDPLQTELDPRNPRLTDEEEGSSQDDLRRILVDKFKVFEVAESIAKSGWLPLDPMVGVEEEGVLRIVEGNRRLAALQLLLDPELAPKNKPQWAGLAGGLTAEVREAISSVEVLVAPSRDHADVESYIAFRHVAGVLPWPALEKASYIAHLVTQGYTYEDIAARISSYPSHVRRHHVAHELVRQAKTLEIDGALQMSTSFGVLLRALQAGGVREFLGMSEPATPQDASDPVPGDHIEQLGEFVRWTFGTAEAPRVLRDSRALTMWAKILSSPESLRYLRSASEPTFQRAWRKAGGERESVSDALWEASFRLEETLPVLKLYRDDEEVRQAVERCELFLSQAREVLGVPNSKA
ncbi:MAG TPA: hypothetical protein VNU01_01715 [Egibacteraceae bacterium]|nr:hypothetical protein [Egibacteraceae bacterium]